MTGNELVNLETSVVSAKAYPGLYTPPALGNLGRKIEFARKVSPI